MSEDTIVAIATPPGQGGVGILRISGDKALAIAKTLTKRKHINLREAHFCHFYDQDERVDQGIILYFQAPHSFTGEDVVELQAHGSPIVLDRLVKLCIKAGAVMANPGQFSERAFLNNKIDLAQAEAIADLIAAQSNTAAQLALRSLEGVFSKAIHAIVEQLIALRLYVEAAIDFPDEEIDFLKDDHISLRLNQVIVALQDLRAESTQGMIMREGISVVIAGRPNAGKSTLINQLAGQEIAIVTDIAGTTRDVVRTDILVDDLPIHIIDTAGIRESSDPVEKEGIKRAWQAIQKSDCILLLMDASDPQSDISQDEAFLSAFPANIPLLKLYNKVDKLTDYPQNQEDVIYLSAKSGWAVDKLKEKIKAIAGLQSGEGKFLARRRHLNAMDDALHSLETGREQLQSHQAGELLAEDLRQAQLALSKITGEFTADDLLGEIFSSFCIGK